MPRSGGYVIAERMGGPRSYDWAVGRADQWSAPLERSDPEQAAAELVRCFLRAFGPATVRDFVWWSWRETHASHTTERAWKTVRDECVEVQHRDRSPGLVLEADVDRLTNPPPLADVRLLPPHDPLLMLPDRATLVPEASLHRRLWRSSHNPGVVLTASDVAATWRWREGRIRVTPLARPLSASTREAIEREAGFIAAARGVPSVEVVFEAA